MKIGVMPDSIVPAEELRGLGFEAVQMFFGGGADGDPGDPSPAAVDQTLAAGDIALALADSTYPVPLAVVAFFALPLGFALFFGRTFCAGVCPMGAMQDLVSLRPPDSVDIQMTSMRLGKSEACSWMVFSSSKLKNWMPTRSQP